MAALIALTLLLGAAPDSPTAEPPAGIDFLLRKAQEAQIADAAAWSRFRFRREALREEMDESGTVLRSETRVSRVTPVPEGFDEELLEIDGRRPTPREVEAHRSAAPFRKHYDAFLHGGAKGERSAGYSLADLFRMTSYRYEGEETVEGVPCHRLSFEPGGTEEEGIAGKLAAAMAGTLWITRDGWHLLRVRARTVRPVSFALSLVKLYDMELEMVSGPVDGGGWIPRRIVLGTGQRFLLRSSRRRNIYQYSDFAPAETPAP
jgi:hypothetical protein